MSWITGLLLLWLLARLVTWGVRALARAWRARSAAPATAAAVHQAIRYGFDAERNQALSLAHPVAESRVGPAFASADVTAWPDRSLRPALLHLLGLRSDLSDAAVRAQLRADLRTRWYRIDLHGLGTQDDPRDAMAFACARVAFAVRMAHLYGWVDEASQWQVLLHNARRAADCFDGWSDYACAWARGRRQWVKAARADSAGLAFDEAQARAWAATPGHPWAVQPWPVHY